MIPVCDRSGATGDTRHAWHLSNLTSLKVASLACPHPAIVLDAYKQLDKVASLNINMLYLPPPWLDYLFPSPTPSTSANTNQNELYLPRLEALTITGVDGARVRELVAGAGLDLYDVDEIVYVGGSASLPGLDETLAQGFPETLVTPFTAGTVVGGGVEQRARCNARDSCDASRRLMGGHTARA